MCTYTLQQNINQCTHELINSLDLSDINMNETLQHDFLYETLIQFDQIIKIATIEIWQDYKQKNKTDRNV
jgi:hypothetical protein